MSACCNVISKINQYFQDPLMEKEYQSVTTKYKYEVFKVALWFWWLVNTASLITLLAKKQFGLIHFSVVLEIMIPILIIIQKRIKKHNETLIVFSSIVLCVSSLIYNQLSLQKMPQSVMYLRGWTTSCFVFVFIRQSLHVVHQVLVIIIVFIVRVSLVSFWETKTLSIDLILRYLLYDGLLIFTCYHFQKCERMIFKSYYEQREKNTKFRELIANFLPQSIIILSRATQKCLFVNKAFLKIYKSESNDVNEEEINRTVNLNNLEETAPFGQFKVQRSSIRKVGTTEALTNLSDGVTNLNQLITELISKKFMYQAVTNHVTLSHQGNEKSFEALIIPVVWDEEEAVTVILNDITSQERLIEMRVVDANKDKFIATVSHELRTPLNGIIGLLQIAEAKTENDEAKEYLSLCKDNANLLLGLVNSLLDLQQLNHGKFKLGALKVDIRKLIKDTLRLFQFHCNHKGIYLKQNISNEVPEFIVTDGNRLKQVLINLIGNAIKFTFCGGITLDVQQDPEHEGHVQISVEDTGVGIKEENKGKLFKMYGKLEDNEGINKNGVGLGLTISAALVQVLSQKNKNNQIQFESQYGVGTKLWFSVSKNLENIPSFRNQTDNKDFNRNFKGLEGEIKELTASYSKEDEEAHGSNFSSSISSLEKLELDSKMSKYTLEKKIAIHEMSPSSSLKKILVSQSFSPFSMTLAKGWESKPPEGVEFLAMTPVQCLSRKNSDSNLLSKSQKRDKDRGCILIVDDNPFNLMIAKHFAEELDFSVETAINGQDALEKIRNSLLMMKQYKAILMDCQMPIMDGFRASMEIRKWISQKKMDRVPIIALTANNTEADIKKCYECGMSDHLTKPLMSDSLEKALKKAEKEI